MSNEIIGFFSSNARDLYKADVFRMLTLPPKYVIHFRYQKKYVHEEILSNLNSILNKDGMVYFAVGNEFSKPEDQLELSLYAIRMVRIIDCDIDNNNEIVNFYLEMGDFASNLPLPDTSSQDLPPNLYVSKLTIESLSVTSWIDRVSSVKEFFKNTLFYYIDSVRINGKEILPSYSSFDKTSFYDLQDECEYKVHVSFYDPQNGELSFKVENPNDFVVFDMPTSFRLGAPRDTKIFTLSTHTLATKKILGRTRLIQPDQQDSSTSSQPLDLSIELLWCVTKSKEKVLRFGLLTVLAACGIISANAVDNSFISYYINGLFFILALLLIGFSAAKLYDSFDKR